MVIGDINADGKVDIRDIATAAKAFGSYPGHPDWNSLADINRDDKVDIRDIAMIAKKYGMYELIPNGNFEHRLLNWEIRPSVHADQVRVTTRQYLGQYALEIASVKDSGVYLRNILSDPIRWEKWHE